MLCYTVHMRRTSRGFALPTVLIAGTLMLIVLMSALVTSTNIRAILQQQYYGQLAREAAESGVIRAQACIDAGMASWSAPLRPQTDCTGGAPCTNNSNCFVISENNVRTSFAVTVPTGHNGRHQIKVTGTVELLRSASGTPWRTVSHVQQADITRSVSIVPFDSTLGHACARINAQRLQCWGDNAQGQLGNGTTTLSMVPVEVDMTGVLAGKDITQIATNDETSCVADTQGGVYCWGSNAQGQLGNGTHTSSSLPVAVNVSVFGGEVIQELDGGDLHMCAITVTGKVGCWGTNAYGQLGIGSTAVDSTVPVLLDTSGALAGKTIVQLVVGDHASCVVTSEGRLYCWGWNGYGTIGDGTTSTRRSPVEIDMSGVLAGKKIRMVAMGFHGCVLTEDNQLYCWGRNDYNQTGDGTTTNRPSPVAVNMSGVLAGKTFTQIIAGPYHTCVLSDQGLSYCWGKNDTGATGDGTTTFKNAPVATDVSGVLAGKPLTMLTNGDDRTCGMDMAGNLYCWGWNGYGALGIGNMVNQPSPILTHAAPMEVILGYRRAVLY